MPLEPAITEIEQLKDNPALAAVLAWRKDAVQGVKFDRGEMSIVVDRALVYEAIAELKRVGFTFLADVTAVDWYPTEPRFQVTYHLLSMKLKERVRIIARLDGSDPAVESVVELFPTANFFEREIFDLFGIRVTGHPDLRRIMMPDNWEGHPLRKDYPVEGYR